jgi:predicted amidophosphoribosyltransferase
MYDNRMTLILHKMVEGVGGDVRELVRTRHSMSPAHLTDFRPTPEGLIANYEIVEELATPTPRVIAVVDDLLTAGAHFKAMKTVLVSRFPGVSVIGIFLARRILPPAQD